MNVVRLLGALGLALCALAAYGQSYPNKPVRFIVPFTAGSATDILARTVGQQLSELWGQPVVVENRPGAGGTIGAAIVAKAPPDGYTLLVHSAGHAVNPWMYANLPFDTKKDFIEIAPLAGQPNVLVVSPSAGYKTVSDLIAAAKKSPGQLNFGSAGNGSGTHINAEKFRISAAIDVVHVPYKGTPEALTDTMTGRITYFFSPISAALPHIKENKLVPLAVSSSKRSSALPNVPTVAESGLPGFDYNLWVGIFAPATTPADVVDKINKDVNRVVQSSATKDRFAALGAEAMPMNSLEFHKFVMVEIDEAGKVIQAAKITAQ